MSFCLRMAGLPPTINHVYWHKQRGRKKIKPEGELYQYQVRDAIRKTSDWMHFGAKLERRHTIRCTITLESSKWLTIGTKKKPSVPSQGKGDVDNRVKFLMDCLQRELGFNDCQVFQLSVNKKVVASDDWTEVQLDQFIDPFV